MKKLGDLDNQEWRALISGASDMPESESAMYLWEFTKLMPESEVHLQTLSKLIDANLTSAERVVAEWGAHRAGRFSRHLLDNYTKPLGELDLAEWEELAVD